MNSEWGAIILNPSCSNNCVFCTAGGHKAKESDIRKQEINVAKNLIDFKKKQIKNRNIWIRSNRI